eukprot:5215542-Heterocapsa_arctica.AAC.1
MDGGRGGRPAVAGPCWKCAGPHLARDCKKGGGKGSADSHASPCWRCGGPHRTKDCQRGAGE